MLQGLDPVMWVGMRRAATSASSSYRNDRHSPPNPIRPNIGAHYQTLQPQPEKRAWSPCEPRESRARVGVVGRRAQDADRHRQGNDPTNEVPSPTPLLGGNII